MMLGNPLRNQGFGNTIRHLDHMPAIKIVILPQFLIFDDQPSFRAKRLHRNLQNRWRSALISCEKVARGASKSQFYFSFWRSALICAGRVKIAILLQFWRSTLISCERLRGARQNRNFTSVLTIDPHFYRDGCTGPSKSQVYSNFWWSAFISCETVAYRDRPWPLSALREKRN